MFAEPGGIVDGAEYLADEEAGTHGSVFPDTYPVFPDLLEAAGYAMGFTGKGWGPGDWQRGGWKRNPAGVAFSRATVDAKPADGINPRDYAADFVRFFEQIDDGKPFCFWYGGHEPHRRYEEGSGRKAGKDLDRIEAPPFLPDTETVRSDIADYYVEVEWFDAQLAKMLSKLEAMGELDNTVVVVTGDNGMPFPRAKANLYDYGIRVPLAIRWSESIACGRHSEALVSFVDFAPTFLELAGAEIPASMTGRSLLPLLSGADDAEPQDYVVAGRERHTHARFDNLGYPARAIRTADYLYIWNMKPERWPAGDPGPDDDWYHDID